MATRTITVGLPPGVVTEDDLAEVATTGDYADLSGKPTIPATAADVGAVAPGDLAEVATTGDYNDLSNLPTIPDSADDIGAAATSHTHTGTQVTVDASGFNGNLTTSDDTVQEIAQKLDDLVIPVAGIADPGGANDDFLQRKSGAWTHRTVAQVKSDLGVGGVAAVISSATFPGYAPIGPNHAPTAGSVNHGLGGLGREAYAPFFCPAGTYDAIGVLSTVAAVSTWRLGIDDNTDGWLGAVLLDAGTVNMNATAGWQVITGLTFTVTHPRWLWTHVKCVAYTATPTVQCLDGVGSAASSPRIPGWPTYSSLPGRALVGAISYINSGSAGVLTAAGPVGPNSATQVGFSQTTPLILLRRSS